MTSSLQETHQDKHDTGRLSLREELLIEYTVEEFSTFHQLHYHVHLEAVIVHLCVIV